MFMQKGNSSYGFEGTSDGSKDYCCYCARWETPGLTWSKLENDWSGLACERCKSRLSTDCEMREARKAAARAAEVNCDAGGAHNWQLIPGQSRLFCSKCANQKSL